ncbi:MAG: hypothetical protein H6Q26_2735 [Bacteroidetes bacterium]|nr:hypothetical protein [Chitinophaga sp. LS1]MBP1652578.1 hypothetical protein [Bacteroidota bacterium]WPV69347.1 hypothetical protein QQL36_11605 [Chitinophaga sp. LS1]
MSNLKALSMKNAPGFEHYGYDERRYLSQLNKINSLRPIFAL